MAEGASLDRLARDAAGGDKGALGELCRELQHPIYRLALRMLSSPEGVEDATQEVLVRIVTKVGSFEGRSRFMTWAYTVATHPRRDRRPILADTTIEAAARQLDLAEAIAEIYRSDPEFVAPLRVYEGLRRSAPDLL